MLYIHLVVNKIILKIWIYFYKNQFIIGTLITIFVQCEVWFFTIKIGKSKNNIRLDKIMSYLEQIETIENTITDHQHKS